jgi:16S rRNA (guanine527-N7)-methyltransferase
VEHRRAPEPLPCLSLDDLATRIAPFGAPLAVEVLERLLRHYEELRAWNARLGLIGSGTFDTVVERHYGESVAALRWIDGSDGGGELLDVGSGAGFPGLVLAICRPRLRVTLLESRERKAAFLRRAARLAGAEVRVITGFLRDALPEGVPQRLDFVTLRAVKLGAAGWRALRTRLAPAGLVLQWTGPATPSPPGFREAGPAVALPGSESRGIRAWTPNDECPPSALTERRGGS